MKCSPNDLQFLFREFPYLKVARVDTVKRFLDFQIQLGLDLLFLLKEYPDHRYEQLEFYNICLKGLSILDEDIIADLTSKYSWQGIVVASWFSILNPSNIFYEYLKNVRQVTPKYNQWIVDLALAEIDGTIFVEDKDLQLKLREFIIILNYAMFQKNTLRKFFPCNILAKENVLKEELRLIFRIHGVVAANKYLQQSPLFSLLLPNLPSQPT